MGGVSKPVKSQKKRLSHKSRTISLRKKDLAQPGKKGRKMRGGQKQKVGRYHTLELNNGAAFNKNNARGTWGTNWGMTRHSVQGETKKLTRRTQGVLVGLVYLCSKK